MPETITLDRFELERFLLIIEASLKITQRHQFFTWAQGVLQGLFPHEILVCVAGELAREQLRIDRFTEEQMTEAQFAAICDVNTGVLPKITRLWEKSGWQPVAIDASSVDAENHPKVSSALTHFQLNNVVAHGTHSANGLPTSFFCFFRIPEPLRERQVYLIELLTPYLHAAWTRVHLGSGSKLKPIALPMTILTSREREILQWIHDGKSNVEIGIILKLSPLTVKNHVQKLLRKLNVQNRAQAVAKGLARNLIEAE